MTSKFKFEEKSVMSELLENNTYMKYEKFNTHKEDSIGWLKYVNPIWCANASTSQWRRNNSNDKHIHRNHRRPSETKLNPHPGIPHSSQDGRKWKWCKQDFHDSLWHQMQSQRIFSTQSLNDTMLRRFKQRMHIHSLWTPSNDNCRNI